ncbi:MAG: LPS assembly lipoprotein LptE [Rickettsiales bacterium]|jgi:hypothetical protein|nr:LPS assembly lipoprotein LptE [Rickettsiales bacterium]
MKKLLIALTLGACGFSPMYTETRTAETAQIFIAPISGTNGIDLRNELIARFNTDNVESAAKYMLSVDLKKPAVSYKALQISGDATWQEIRLTAAYTLKSGDAVVASGTASAAESYTFVRDLVSANAARTNAEQNVISVLAGDIASRINAKLGG